MPRRSTITGRVERNANRNREFERYHANVNERVIRNSNNVESNDNDEIVMVLRDSPKIALHLIPSNFYGHDCGLMNLKCRHCFAKHFSTEITQRDRTQFTSCCHKGKVRLPDLGQVEFFNRFYDGLCSNDQLTRQMCKNYFDNIRKYNSAFAMISSEAQIADTTLHGVYHFKIHDVFYHRVGPLTASYGSAPRYAQLYFYDVDTAVTHRMREPSNQSCDSALMRRIADALYVNNPFVRSFNTMKDVCNQRENAEKEISMLIKVDRELDMRRYNDATVTDVAVIFSTNDGEPPYERNMVCFNKTSGAVKKVSVLDPSLDPLAYPLLFPNGATGWHPNMVYDLPSTSSSAIRREKITMLQYACYRLAVRDAFSLLHHSTKLYLQWIVDMYVRIEGSRLFFIRNNQQTLRTEVLNNLTDYLHQRPTDDSVSIGRSVILPSSFNGSPRNMYQNYLDAMSIVQHFGKPSLFITMTCNPKWPEIIGNIDPLESANFRPEIIVRVFKSKLNALIDSIVKQEIFGKTEAIIYTIEFQKRGLPHAHILLTLHEDDKISDAVDIDKVVCAEIPDPITQPKLRQYVVSHMMHGPCGSMNPRSVCMRDGKCTKEFPKNFIEATCLSVNGYPLYRRRDNGVCAEVRGKSLDNRYVVPYNPYLLAKFNCHINVEVCTSVKSVKYIYKYVYKGYDSATIQVGEVGNDASLDEVQNFVNGRYVGSTESMWRILEYPMHFQSHTIVRLDIHLPNRQNVYFRDGQEQRAVLHIRQTKLLAFFTLNQQDSSANQYKYTEIPLHYTWIDAQKKWRPRSRGGEKVISRMYIVSPRDVELFHLRLLLLHVCGPKSFEDVRTYNDVVYSTFVEACHARGIASNDNEWRQCLDEAKEFHTPRQLRDLFAYICALNMPANVLSLWDDFKVFLCEDYLRDNPNEEIAFNRCLLHLEDVFIAHNLSCERLGLPVPRILSEIVDANEFDVLEQQLLFDELYSNANDEQRNVINRVIREVEHHNTGSNVFCLTAHAGCGKTFTQTAIIHRIQALNKYCIATAFSGIASTLLIGGRTLHNAFKLPIPLLDTSVSNITPNSVQGRYIKSASLIIIDEISMCPLQVLKVIDKLMKDLVSGSDKNKLFGGKTMFLCGDFRQILPVVPHASRSVLIENCITSWNEFAHFHKMILTQNMRALPHEIEFVDFLKQIGDGTSNSPEFGGDIIELPRQIIGNLNNILTEVFGNIADEIESDRILKSVVLAPTNEDCALVNRQVLNLIPGDQKVYHSHDRAICDSESEVNNYPVEFLNSLNMSGLPPHKLELKVNCVVLLIRNLNTKEALVNGTRMRVKHLHANTIDCQVLTGTARRKRILIPRIKLTYSGTILPFEFERTQFPIIPAFAMTINKSQGQTFQNVGVLLRRPVFSHGQLYVAASRVRSFDGLKFYVAECEGQGHLFNDNRVFTKNIVYREILRNN